ncbi:oxoglutarate dehydrogenase [Colletotrichum camelliae]|nr:oxoglutarate dehydrogenase [Colletotrichum camelliae]
MLRSLRAASRCEAVKVLAAPQSTASACARRHHASRMSLVPKLQQACFSSGTQALSPVKGRSYATAAEAVDLRAPPSPIDSFLQGGAANYVDEMYLAWKANPKDVHVSWQTYFRNMEDPTVPSTQAFRPPPGLMSSRYTEDTPVISVAETSDGVNYLKAQSIVRAFQEYGHTNAKINPLGDVGSASIQTHPDLPSCSNLSKYGFTTADLDREIPLGPDLFPHLASTTKTMPLRDIIALCETIYSGSFGVEYHHISSPAKRDWIRQRVEIYHASPPSPAEKQRILDTLIWATSLERFLATKFPNEKRFGLDGAEGLAPGLAALIDRCADVHGVQDIVIGSCHRGRMNVMSTVYGKDFETLFRQFAETEKFDVEAGQTGDVKYHFGMEGERTTAGGGVVGVEMLPNPSHLEAVDPFAQGKAKAVQETRGDVDQSKVMFMALHGDAAFSGQGPVYETLNLSGLKGYEVGGTMRLMVNNQIGFTTDSPDSRSTPYCSDLAKYIEAPIFHVNADDPEAVVFLCKLAVDWRAEFRSDIVIDVNCYRRFGHNEIDQASFTQPEMYKKIAKQPALLEKYIEKLVGEGTMQAEVVEEQKRWVWEQLEEKLTRSKLPADQTHAIKTEVATVPEPFSTSTAVNEATLSTIAEAITSVPEGFNLHRNLQRILAAKKQAFDAGTVDWSTAEALAFGSLVLEGKPVRISGQDVERGTFSQRHSVLHDQTTHAEYTPLNHLQEGQPARYTAVNSPLSEFGVLGFDYGYSLAAAESLVMWEAQFGDFANNAQVVIDQFVTSGEAKWLLRSGLVMSLPHGYDGQGPEHSSARLGRFLELGSEDPRAWPEDLGRARRDCNVRIVYMTTPANLFHALRRQIYSPYKKPLIIFFSKSLLRHPLARSSVQELTGTSAFQPVLSDPEHGNSIVPREEINRVILCSGQVYASLHKHREANGIKNTAITRIEELHPFPWAEVKENIDSYPNAQTIVWCQEEPYNGGAWQYMRDRLETVASESENHKFSRIVYAGRGTGAAAATGSKKVHQAEEERLSADAFGDS